MLRTGRGLRGLGWRPLPLDADYRSLVASGQVYVTGPGVDGILVLVTGPEAMGVENIAW